MDSLGTVWQPTIAVEVPGWRPYCHGGRWLWTEWGWYWDSAYAWGNIPFHYGWWVRTPVRGWVWIPGGYWAPAWVCWRSSPGYYGWAPLPPPPYPGSYASMGLYSGGFHMEISFGLTHEHYVFTSSAHLCSPTPSAHAVDSIESQSAYEKSTPSRDFSAFRDRIEARIPRGPTYETASEERINASASTRQNEAPLSASQAVASFMAFREERRTTPYGQAIPEPARKLQTPRPPAVNRTHVINSSQPTGPMRQAPPAARTVQKRAVRAGADPLRGVTIMDRTASARDGIRQSLPRHAF
ncbi:MAG: hypothetical protein FJ224_05690 [Lentisphaerae bacterium]|nr:hypothetical protein [Lentisphaerota bacterium]